MPRKQETTSEGVYFQNQIAQLQQQNTELWQRNQHLVTQLKLLKEEFDKVSKLQSLIPLTGILNLRTVQDDEEITQLVRRLVLRHMSTLDQISVQDFEVT